MSGKKIRVTNEDVAKFLELHNKGWTSRVISVNTTFSHTCVRNHISAILKKQTQTIELNSGGGGSAKIIILEDILVSPPAAIHIPTHAHEESTNQGRAEPSSTLHDTFVVDSENSNRTVQPTQSHRQMQTSNAHYAVQPAPYKAASHPNRSYVEYANKSRPEYFRVK